MEQILIPSLVGTVVLLPAILSLISALLRRSGEERAFRGLSILWGLRAVLAVLLAAWWMAADPVTLAAYESLSRSIWRDDSLPELTLSVRLDRLALLFLAIEALLSAVIFPTALPRSSTTRTPKPEAWLYFGWLTSAVDLFVFSSHLLLTLGCGILIVRIYERSRQSAATVRDLATASTDRAPTDAETISPPAVLRWSEVGLWVTLLLSWHFFDDGSYAALCDTRLQQTVHADNPAAIPVISCCLIGIVLVLGRFFPFLLLDRSENDEPRIDGLRRSLLVWPLGFWLLFRLAPLWQNVPVACQLLGLTGAITAVLAIVQGGVAQNRNEIPAWCTVAHAGLMAMLFSTGSPTGLCAGLAFLWCHAPARTLIELTMIPSSTDRVSPISRPTHRAGLHTGIAIAGIIAALAVLTGGAGGEGTLVSMLGLAANAGVLSSATGLPLMIIRIYPWIAVFVLCGEAWSLTRCAASGDETQLIGKDTRFPQFIVLFAMTIAAGAICTWKMDVVLSALFPSQNIDVEKLAVDASLVGMLWTGVMLSVVGVWLLYRVNPEWRRPLRNACSPLVKVADRQGYLPDAWRLMVWQPLQYIVDLVEFCEHKLLPLPGRLCGKLGSFSTDYFLTSLEHGNVRLYGITVVLTTVVMLCLFLFPIG